jgi:hypothetical protein
MPTIRRADERFLTDLGWLRSRHTFSFGEHHDPAFMGYRSLRVINDDVVQPGTGFGTHSHKDMEIISIVLEGHLEHKDSLGSGEVLSPGEVQVMSAGQGIRHSEFNPSRDARVHFLQVWILPEAKGLPPAYAQKRFDAGARVNALQRVAGRDGIERDGALKINQDANLYLATIDPGKGVAHTLLPQRGAWVHVASGSVIVNGSKLSEGDSLSIEGPAMLSIVGADHVAEVLLFDLH